MRFPESITRAIAINNSSPGVVQYTDAPKSDVPVKRNILPRGATLPCGRSALPPASGLGGHRLSRVKCDAPKRDTHTLKSGPTDQRHTALPTA